MLKPKTLFHKQTKSQSYPYHLKRQLIQFFGNTLAANGRISQKWEIIGENYAVNETILHTISNLSKKFYIRPWTVKNYPLRSHLVTVFRLRWLTCCLKSSFYLGNSWLGFCAFYCAGPGSIPDPGTKILQMGQGQEAVLWSPVNFKRW